MIKSAPTAAPTPIPAFAPELSPSTTSSATGEDSLALVTSADDVTLSLDTADASEVV